MAVPLLDVPAQNGPLANELQNAFSRVLQSGRYVLGPEVQAFEQEMAKGSGVDFGIGVSSGTDALLVALLALEIGPGDEVLCPSFTFFATAGSIARTGATPVFVDSLPDTFNLNLSDAAAKITDRTRAIIPVHLFGRTADMEAVQSLADTHDLKIIEDVAQAQGAATPDGKPAGGQGDFGAFSFYPTKNLGGLGDGGMLVTHNPTLAEKARLYRNHGANPKYHHETIGGNFRLDELQAALLRIKHRHLAGWIARRQENAQHYLAALADLEGVLLPDAVPGHTWNQFTLRLTEPGQRDALATHLRDAAIGHEIYYPEPLHAQPCFTQFQADDCPVATALCGQVISLPIYPEMESAHLDEVISAIRAFLGGS